MKPEIAAMTREEYLLYRGRNEGITITDTDLACARHYDNCSICQDDAKSSMARERQAERTEDARRVLAVGVLRYRQELEALRKRASRGEKVPTDTELLDAVIKGLRKLEAAGARAGAA